MDRSEDLPFDWWTALSLSDEVAKLPEEVSDPDLFSSILPSSRSFWLNLVFSVVPIVLTAVPRPHRSQLRRKIRCISILAKVFPFSWVT